MPMVPSKTIQSILPNIGGVRACSQIQQVAAEVTARPGGAGDVRR
jgi:hypothetical protein